MGLDMYLTKRTYVENWEHNGYEGHWEFDITKGGKKSPIKKERITYVIEEVCYWRKANHIHKWFVQNVQGGVDECQESYVRFEQLEELRDTLKRVVTDDVYAAEELLPTQDGFFFGGTDYDERYEKENIRTLKVLDKLLSEPDASKGDYFYHASW